jgi:transposase
MSVARQSSRAHPRQERDPRDRDPAADRPAAGDRPVRRQGPQWLAALELPIEERETLQSCLRRIAFFDAEIADVDRLIARAALASAQVRRLMTVPGVNVITAATFLATIGDISRFGSPRKLVGYLGLDPRVRQSGSAPAAHGHISRRGARRTREALVEACWSAVRQPGPLWSCRWRSRPRIRSLARAGSDASRRRGVDGLGPPVTRIRTVDLGVKTDGNNELRSLIKPDVRSR